MIKIVILPEGWVYIGTFTQSGTRGTLTNASTIYRWDTKGGFGELALTGVKTNMELYPIGTVEFEIPNATLIDVTSAAKTALSI